MANPKEKTPMCLVNELARFNKIQPEYKLLCEQGPAHSKVLSRILFSFFTMLALGHGDGQSVVFPLSRVVFRFSQFDSHWEISTGRQKVPASRKPSIRLLRLPSLRRHCPSPPRGCPATQARTPAGSSHWLCCSRFLLDAWQEKSFHMYCFSLCWSYSRRHDTHHGVKCTMYEDR